MNGRTALIAGATGLVGSHCLQASLSHYEHVIALTRRSLPEHPRLEQHIVDFDRLDALDFRADDVFSALGSIMNKVGSWEAFERVEREYPSALARLAARSGAQQFTVVSTVDATAFGARWVRYTDMRRAMEAAVTAQPFRAVHICRPGLLVGKREHFRLGEGLLGALAPLINLLWHGKRRYYRAIAGRDVGRAMVAAALRGEAGIHIYHYDEMRALAASLKD